MRRATITGGVLSVVHQWLSWGLPVAGKVGAVVVAAGLIWLAMQWGRWGLAFYDRVVPFYDSLSYQDGYYAVAERSERDGVLTTLAAVWKEPNNNVVLYKFAAAVLGQFLPPGKVGLYVYLFGVHLAGLAGLGVVTWRLTGRVHLAVLASAAWLAAVPFGLVKSGVGDQRMDLASASFYLLNAALALLWSRNPGASRAGWVGIAAALAVLHRPVMAATLAVMIGLFAVRAILAHRRPVRVWVMNALAMVLPGAVLSLPWLIAHASELHRYYLVANVDLGNAASVGTAARYNLNQFAAAFGLLYAGILALGMGGLMVCRRIAWLDILTVVAATILPLATLAFSKSAGNVFVSQIPLGVPALMLACVRPRAAGKSEPVIPLAVALVVFGVVAASSVAALRGEVEALRGNPRAEVVQVLNTVLEKKPRVRVAAFQDNPVNVVAMAAIARELRLPVDVGTYGYHAPHFGLPNQPVGSFTSDDLRRGAESAIAGVAARDDVLLLPSEETRHLLYPEPLSHRLIPEMGRQVTSDPRFVHVGQAGPVSGMAFDVYVIERAEAD